MKYIKLIFISAFVFFALASIVAFFIPSKIRVFRMTRIAASQGGVLDQVKDLSDWKSWYPGMEDVRLENQQAKNGKVVKALVNDISIEILQVLDSSVEVKMQRGARPVLAGWQINKDIRNDSLTLEGYMDFKLKWYPWEKFSSLMLDKTYGERIAKGLENLKRQGS